MHSVVRYLEDINVSEKFTYILYIHIIYVYNININII